MIKTKSQKRIFMLLAALLVLSSTSFAAKAVKYDWTGAVDVDWDNPGNWDVTGSAWTWPNEQYGGSWVNVDCDEINIATGGIVDRFGSLNINGAADGSNEVVLTIDNNSELNVHPGWGKDIWIANGGDSKGRVEVRDGSHLVLVDGAIRIGEGNASVGTLDVVNGTVDIAQWLIVGRTSTGIVEIENSTLNIAGWGDWSSLYVAYKSNSTGTLDIKNGNVNIEASLLVGNADNSTGTVEIKSSTLNIGNSMSLGHKGEGTSGSMGIKDNSIINIGANLNVGNSGSSTGTLEIKDSTLSIGSDLEMGNSDSSTGTVEIKSSIVDIGNNLEIGIRSTGMIEIKDSTLDIDWNLAVGVNKNSTGTVEIKDSTLNILHRLILTRKGNSGIMSIKGNSNIIINERFQMGTKPTINAVSELVMDDGTVTVGSDSRLNSEGGAGSMADFTLNDGTWINGGNIYVGETPEGDCHLTINGGMMQAGQKIFVGRPGGDDFGQSRIFLNGGLLQGEGLEFNMDADTLIVYRGGELWINNSALSEAGMQGFIDSGKIDVPPDYEITTIGTYTVLRS